MIGSTGGSSPISVPITGGAAAPSAAEGGGFGNQIQSRSGLNTVSTIGLALIVVVFLWTQRKK